MGKKRQNPDFPLESQLPFEEWVEYLRDDTRSLNWNCTPEGRLLRLQKLLSSTAFLLDTYSMDEINQLLWHVAGDSGVMQLLWNSQIAECERLRTIDLIGNLFENLFERHCSPLLVAGLMDYPEGTSPLNSICYMWWDIFPSWGQPDDPQASAVDEAIMNLLKKLIENRNLAVQESAFHGLGHWHVSYPIEVEAIVDAFFEKRKYLPDRLREYALSARAGYVN